MSAEQNMLILPLWFACLELSTELLGPRVVSFLSELSLEVCL